MNSTNVAGPSLKRVTLVPGGKEISIFIRKRNYSNGIRYSQFARALAGYQNLNLDKTQEKAEHRKMFGADHLALTYFEPHDWVELLNFLEDSLDLATVDTDAWEALGGGRPETMSLKNIHPKLNLFSMYIFILECPVKESSTPTKLVKYRKPLPYPFGEDLPLADKLRFVLRNYVNFGEDWLNIPDGFKIFLEPHQRNQLRLDLDDFARHLDFDFDDDELEATLIKPNLVFQDLSIQVVQSYTSQIA